jgi:hypothetical protein
MLISSKWVVGVILASPHFAEVPLAPVHPSPCLWTDGTSCGIHSPLTVPWDFPGPSRFFWEAGSAHRAITPPKNWQSYRLAPFETCWRISVISTLSICTCVSTIAASEDRWWLPARPGTTAGASRPVAQARTTLDCILVVGYIRHYRNTYNICFVFLLPKRYVTFIIRWI